MKLPIIINGNQLTSKEVLRDLSRTLTIAVDRVLAAVPPEKAANVVASISKMALSSKPPPQSMPENLPLSIPVTETLQEPVKIRVLDAQTGYERPIGRPSEDSFRWNPQFARPPRIAGAPAPFVASPTQSSLKWSEPQFRYYCYWRSEFLKGHFVATDSAYVLELAREGSRIHKTFNSLLDEWERLRVAYPHVPCMRFDRWLGVGRIISGRYKFTDDEQEFEFESSHSADAGWIGFDLALLSGRAPRAADLRDSIDRHLLETELTSRAKSAVRGTVERLRYASGADSLMVVALSAPPKDVMRRVFGDNPECSRYYKTPGGNRFRRGQDGQLNALLPSYLETVRVRHEIERLVLEALSFVDRKIGGAIVPIRTRTYPEFDTLEGLIVTARYALSEDALVLLAVVLRMSESKPWIEGQIALSKDLRTACDRAFAGVGAEGGLSALKRAYFELLSGSRAPWTCDDRPAEASMLKVNTTRARFARNLQRELLGSASRNQVVGEIASILAERRHSSSAELSQALSSETICGGKE